MIIFSFINSILYAIYGYILGVFLFETVPKFNIKHIFALLFFIISFYLIVFSFTPIYTIFFSCIIYTVYLKLIFQKSIYLSIFYGLIIYMGRMLFKILFVLFNINNYSFVCSFHNYNINEFYVNIISTICTLIIIVIFKKYFVKIVKYIASLKYKFYILICILYFNILIVSIFRLPYLHLNHDKLSDIIIISIVTIIILKVLNQEKKIELVTKICEESKVNDELIKHYRTIFHENNNKLIAIKGMLGENPNKIEKYINSILKDKTDKILLTELINFPLIGVRNFINHKLLKMKKLGVEIEIFVSNDLNNINSKQFNEKFYNNLYTILGVLLDNMIDALKNNDEKLASVQFYLVDNIIYGEFVNTFSNDIDLDKIYNLGFSTKGKNHGYGLSLIDEIIKNNECIDLDTNIIDKYFVQKLKIKLNH